MSFFGVFFRVLFGAQRVPKGSPKGSKIDEKEVSKRYLKKGPTTFAKMMICRTPQCGSSVVNNGKINDFRVLVLALLLVSFWGRFESPSGGQKHEKVVPKSHSKTSLKNDRFFVDFGVPLGTLWAPQKHSKKHTKKRHPKRPQNEHAKIITK